MKDQQTLDECIEASRMHETEIRRILANLAGCRQEAAIRSSLEDIEDGLAITASKLETLRHV